VGAALWVRGLARPPAGEPTQKALKESIAGASPGRSQHATTATASTPHLINASSPATIETRPGAPGYSPQKLANLMGTFEVFYREPRAEAWASAVEGWLKDHMARDLERMAPGKRLSEQVTVECRSTTCRFGWGDPTQRPLLEAAVTALYPPARRSRGNNEMFATYYGGEFYRNVRQQDAPSLFSELEYWRARNLRVIRTKPSLARANRWDRVPLEAWPEK
jgi:hypothetical protein